MTMSAASTGFRLGRKGVRVAAALLLACTAIGASAAPGDPGSGNRAYFSRCIGCHGVGGKSVNPNAPNLVGNERLLQPEVALLMRIKTGKNQCPPFLGIMSDQEIRDLIAYLRTLH
jgi:cytochrome c6